MACATFLIAEVEFGPLNSEIVGVALRKLLHTLHFLVAASQERYYRFRSSVLQGNCRRDVRRAPDSCLS